MTPEPPRITGLHFAEPQRAQPADLALLTDQLLQEATERPNGLRTKAIIQGPLQQAVLFALRAGAQLPEHDSPPAATLQVLRGQVVLVAGEERWRLAKGSLLPIPPVRHHVDAVTDAVCLLTICRGEG
ncbi:LuxR family transcriptional regulator [Ornithinimicrobium ciconiae]|uniref:LuxR family transcriptional regulator n=1 Tax=Ornithinimicrobium ciconiae TaxID=2594265 RepID=A0A516G634_9MICO|nr:cupin domain-containing protein [Ornithinimicrobium ciconiae]QDO86983.1 LuxR family transcriptional regulator [Ornithinimicrobium ciconiae]